MQTVGLDVTISTKHCKNRWVGFTQKNWVASWVSRLRTPISVFALFLPKHMFLGRKYPKCNRLSQPNSVWVGSWLPWLRTPISGFAQFLPKLMFLGRKYPKCNGYHNLTYRYRSLGYTFSNTFWAFATQALYRVFRSL